jgi:inorganic pyrophosphatase
MNILHDIDKSRITSERFTAVIEIPAGCRMKYELDKPTGMLMLDRILKTAMMYPANYGFIPRTLSEDGDPLDVLVIMNDPVPPLTLIECKAVGTIEMVDNGEMDEKILALPCFSDETCVPPALVDEIVHFLKCYKALQKDNNVTVKKVGDRAAAVKIIDAAIALYDAKGGKQ